MKMLRHRRDSELKRYRTLYNVDIEDPANFDLYVISDDAAIDDICAVIRLFADGGSAEKNWIPKARLIPLVDPPDDASQPKDSAIVELQPLSLSTSRNFGLFSGEPAQLLSALRSPLALIPFQTDGSEARRYLLDPLEAIKGSLTPEGLRAWEDLARD